MGLSFDANGMYIGWSNLFDYSSLETIRASEYLPMPKGKIYEVTSDGFNIDSFIQKISEAVQPETKIYRYVELLNYLNKYEITQITYTHPEGDQIVEDIRMHEATRIPQTLIEDAQKNFISSHIQNTVQNFRNMIGAYSPIEMEDFREASEHSPKGEQASRLTLFNPATKLIMQYQNITGKNVIGIAANGEKASFMWHYYINDIVQQANTTANNEFLQKQLNQELAKIGPTLAKGIVPIDVKKYVYDTSYAFQINSYYDTVFNQLPTLVKLKKISQKISYSTFNFTSNRIQGRSTGDPTSQVVNTLPQVNFEGINEQLMKQFGIQLTGDITVDLMISQVLSAATDRPLFYAAKNLQ